MTESNASMMTTTEETPNRPARPDRRSGSPRRRRLSASTRRAVLLVHIVAGVGWLGIAAVTFFSPLRP